MSQWLPIADLAQKVQAGELTAVALVEQALATIDSQQEFKAIIVTLAERARRRAQAIDAAIKAGQSAGRHHKW